LAQSARGTFWGGGEEVGSSGGVLLLDAGLSGRCLRTWGKKYRPGERERGGAQSARGRGSDGSDLRHAPQCR